MIPLNTINRMRRAGSVGINVFILRHGARYVLIWSAEWGAWWGPGAGGYTTDRRKAGVYTFLQALKTSGHAGPEKMIMYDFVRPTDTQ
jgi:hypothetical protein